MAKAKGSESFEREMKTQIISTDSNKCGLCNEQKPKYTCPKCGVLYCSLICYRSYGHMQCSENFFKEFVLKEIENHNQQTQPVQVMKEKMEILLRKDNETRESDLDSDDSEDENQEDLLNRIKNVDLNDSEVVWNCLSEKERKDFQKKIFSGEITEFLPNWDPWWIKTENNLVEDLEIPRSDIPPIKKEIPLLSTMMKKKPNEAVVNGLANILYGYACISRLFLQDWTGNANSIIEILLTISEILCTNLLFKTAQEALDRAHSSAFKHVDISRQLSLLVKHDIVLILKQQKFVLTSLSDVSELLHKGIDSNFTPKKRLLMAIKKVEFYMSFVNEYGVHTLKLR